MTNSACPETSTVGASLVDNPAPYDALLLLSFGGPNRTEDVVPFLRNVVRGKNIPDDRLEAVGEH